jgi:hypothetical protein
MRARGNWAILALAGLLATCGRGSAQDPAPGRAFSLPTLQPRPGSRLTLPGFSDPIFAAHRRGSPVETLERMTGERATEFSQEREGERAAEPDEIETDRDSFTPATALAGRGRLIVESAYSFVDNRGIKETHSVPELILRYGLTERIELRLGWNYEVGGAGNETSGADVSDEDVLSTRRSSVIREYTLAYGAKIRVTDQNRWVPGSALIVQGFTPTGGSAGTSTATQMIATYVAGWQFPNRWKFDAAIRYGTASEEGDHFHAWAPSAVLKVPVGEKWAAHVEYFRIFTSGKEQNFTKHFISPGLHYLVTSDFEIGFRLGWGLNDQSARFFSNVGIGWRF